MKRKFFSVLSSIVITVCICSCASLGIIQEPRVSIRSVDLANISIEGIDMVCRLNVENPNLFDIPFPEIDWKLFINSNSFINGILKNNTKLGSNRTVTIDVPFSVTFAGLYGTFASLLESSEAAYQIALGIKFPLPVIEEKTFNLDFSGNIPLFKFPDIQLGSLNTAKIDFTGVEQELVINITNPNSFPIPFPEFDWVYAIQGSPLLRGGIASAGLIAANVQTPVTIKAGIQYADIIGLLGSLGNSPELPSVMKMDSIMPVPFLEEQKSSFEFPSVIPVFHKPEISFRGINIKDMGMLRMEFLLTWEIVNKNNFALDIDEFKYDLMVNNALWAEGTLNNVSQIRANSTTVIPLDITISSVNLVTQIIDIINRGSGVNFSTKGNIKVNGNVPGLENLGLPFDLAGTTRLNR